MMNISLLQEEEEEELDDVDAMKEKDEIDDDDDDDVIAPPLRAISRHSSTSSLAGRTHTHERTGCLSPSYVVGDSGPKTFSTIYNS